MMAERGSSTGLTPAGWSRTWRSAALRLTDGQVLVKKHLAFLWRS
jgi:hypothetical protein